MAKWRGALGEWEERRVANATGNGSSCRRHRKWPRNSPLSLSHHSPLSHKPLQLSFFSSIRPSTPLNYRDQFCKPFVLAFPVLQFRVFHHLSSSPFLLLWYCVSRLHSLGFSWSPTFYPTASAYTDILYFAVFHHGHALGAWKFSTSTNFTTIPYAFGNAVLLAWLNSELLLHLFHGYACFSSPLCISPSYFSLHVNGFVCVCVCVRPLAIVRIIVLCEWVW